MMGPTQMRTACLPGSFEFTPEGYAKCSLWKPEDAFTWDDFPSECLLEEYEAKLAEFNTNTAGKIEIAKMTYRERSLRSLLPDRWGLSYDRHGAWKKVQGDSYCQRKHTLYFKSIILGYGDGPIKRLAPSGEFAKYIKEHCASSARLKAIALRAYESVANILGYHTWHPKGPEILLCLTAAHSSLDSMAAVVSALIQKGKEIPKGRAIPGMSVLYRDLWPDKKKKDRLAFGDEFVKLYESPWFTKLQDARDKLVHRAAAPFVRDKFGVAFDFDLGMFKDIQPVPTESKLGADMEIIHLDEIMKGFVIDLEKWEEEIAAKLYTLTCFQSYNKNGVLYGIEFWDENLLHDGSGPTHSVRSDSAELWERQ